MGEDLGDIEERERIWSKHSVCQKLWNNKNTLKTGPVSQKKLNYANNLDWTQKRTVYVRWQPLKEFNYSVGNLTNRNIEVTINGWRSAKFLILKKLDVFLFMFYLHVCMHTECLLSILRG